MGISIKQWGLLISGSAAVIYLSPDKNPISIALLILLVAAVVLLYEGDLFE